MDASAPLHLPSAGCRVETALPSSLPGVHPPPWHFPAPINTLTRLVRCCLSLLPGYSQARSSPSKPWARRKGGTDLTKVLRLWALAAIFENLGPKPAQKSAQH